MSDEEKRVGAVPISWLGIAIGVPYFIGYLTVAVYLARFSVVPLDLIRVQYIAAGAWAILPLLLFLYPISYLAGYLQDAFGTNSRRERGPRWRYILSAVGHVLFGLFSAFGLCGMLISLLRFSVGESLDAVVPKVGTYEIARFLGISLIFAVAIVGTIFFTWLFFSGVTSADPSQSFNRLAWGCCYFFISAGAVIGYVFFFATNMYGKIPSYLGGGAPVSVEVLLKEKDASEAVKQLSGHYDLLTTTEHSIYLLRANDNQAIEMSRDAVAAIRYGVLEKVESESTNKR